MQVFQFFVLLPYDLLVLELEQLTFLLKVGYDLAQTLLKEIYLGLH